MIEFFRDVLDGPVYIILVIICIILIMAIIGFIMERKQLEKEEKSKRIVVEGTTPIEPVRVREEIISNPLDNTQSIPNPLTNPEEELKRDMTFTLNSNDVKVEEVVNTSSQEETKVEDVATVIDFGSTKDVEIDRNN